MIRIGVWRTTDGKPCNLLVSCANIRVPRSFRLQPGYNGQSQVHISVCRWRLSHDAVAQQTALPDWPPGANSTVGLAEILQELQELAEACHQYGMGWRQALLGVALDVLLVLGQIGEV